MAFKVQNQLQIGWSASGGLHAYLTEPIIFNYRLVQITNAHFYRAIAVLDHCDLRKPRDIAQHLIAQVQ